MKKIETINELEKQLEKLKKNEHYKDFDSFATLHPYAKTAYENSMNFLLGDSKKCCVIFPTGHGKTAVSGHIVRVLHDLGVVKNVLVLAPAKSIMQGTKRNFFNHHVITGKDNYIDYMTYAELNVRVKTGDLRYFSKYDLIIPDEMHHLGSSEWGKSWRELCDFHDKVMVLGLTATENRYLEGRDMAKELFGDNIAYHFTLPESWDNKWCIAPKYVIATDIESELGDAENRLSKIKDKKMVAELQKEVDALKANWKRTRGLDGIMKDELSYKEHHLTRLIVFHERIDETPALQRQLHRMFTYAGYKNIEFYVANIGIDNGKIEGTYSSSIEEIEKFNERELDGSGKPTKKESETLKILLSIGMVSEGLHVDNCYAEIMFRATKSKNVFLQQLGRVIDVNNTSTRPIVIDCVQNVALSNTIYEQFKREVITDDDETSDNDEKTVGVEVDLQNEDLYKLRIVKKHIVKIESLKKAISDSEDEYRKIIKLLLEQKKNGQFKTTAQLIKNAQ